MLHRPVFEGLHNFTGKLTKQFALPASVAARIRKFGSMFKKGAHLHSILHSKCPRCQEGNLFVTGPYNLRHFMRMPEQCSVCGQRFQLEPDFWQGAMYVSYGIQVTLMVAVYVVLRVFFDPSMEVYLAAIIIAVVVLFPVTFRLSRVIYLNLFVKYGK